MIPPKINDDEMPLLREYDEMATWLLAAFDKEDRNGYPVLCIKHVPGKRAILYGIMQDESTYKPDCYSIEIFDIMPYYDHKMLAQYLIESVKKSVG